MVSPHTVVEYRNTLFETATLPSHAGEPTFESIKRSHNILKANAQDVQCFLGGANHGYLGLLLSDASYALISATPFVRPAHPGVLVVPPGTTAHMSTNMRISHEEALRVFKECKGVEKALLQQFLEVYDNIYLDALRDANTNAINLPIRDFFPISL